MHTFNFLKSPNQINRDIADRIKARRKRAETHTSTVEF